MRIEGGARFDHWGRSSWAGGYSTKINHQVCLKIIKLLTSPGIRATHDGLPVVPVKFHSDERTRIFPPPPPGWRTRGIVGGLRSEIRDGSQVGCVMYAKFQILFLPLGIFDSYVSLIQNNIFFGTSCRISDLTNLAVTSWNISCLLNPGLYDGVDYMPLE